MRVKEILEGDIVRGVVQLKNRPCVVLKVEKDFVLACPLTTESPRTSKIKTSTTRALANNRFLKTKSYFTFSVIQITMDDAKNNMLGMVKKATLKAIKNKLNDSYKKYLETF